MEQARKMAAAALEAIARAAAGAARAARAAAPPTRTHAPTPAQQRRPGARDERAALQQLRREAWERHQARRAAAGEHSQEQQGEGQEQHEEQWQRRRPRRRQPPPGEPSARHAKGHSRGALYPRIAREAATAHEVDADHLGSESGGADGGSVRNAHSTRGSRGQGYARGFEPRGRTRGAAHSRASCSSPDGQYSASLSSARACSAARRAMQPGGAGTLLDGWLGGEDARVSLDARGGSEDENDDTAFLSSLADAPNARPRVSARRELNRRFRETRRSEWARRRAAELLFEPDAFDRGMRALQRLATRAPSRPLLEALLGACNMPWPAIDEVGQRAGGQKWRTEYPRGDDEDEWHSVDDGLREIPLWELRSMGAAQLAAAARARNVHVHGLVPPDSAAGGEAPIPPPGVDELVEALTPALARERQDEADMANSRRSEVIGVEWLPRSEAHEVIFALFVEWAARPAADGGGAGAGIAHESDDARDLDLLEGSSGDAHAGLDSLFTSDEGERGRASERANRKLGKRSNASTRGAGKAAGRSLAAVSPTYLALAESADMRAPHEWFPLARGMRRRVVYHAGPTNSGKTHDALQRLAGAESGVYSGPLRLLAMEVFERLNAAGAYCSLRTGQEKTLVPFARHESVTAEMLRLDRVVDVAVVDEVQLMGDAERGWAWTRAVCGLPAAELHLCGDPSALPRVREICEATGDELTVVEHTRHTPLALEPGSLEGDLRRVQKGDAVVTFSRRDIFDTKALIEAHTGLKCAVVYGNLPPEMRSQQARLFNEPEGGADVLVASDAIGMGLNLNIRRVVFLTASKYNAAARKAEPLSTSLVKQIAGRAGRRGTAWEHGRVTVLKPQDRAFIEECLATELPQLDKAGLHPSWEQFEEFARRLCAGRARMMREGLDDPDVVDPKALRRAGSEADLSVEGTASHADGDDVPFPRLLDHFQQSARVDGSTYFLSNFATIRALAQRLEAVSGLSLEARFSFCFAPVALNMAPVMASWMGMARALATDGRVLLEHAECHALGAPGEVPKTHLELHALEAMHQKLSLYRWLNIRFGESAFPQRLEADMLASDVEGKMAAGLAELTERNMRERSKFQEHVQGLGEWTNPELEAELIKRGAKVSTRSVMINRLAKLLARDRVDADDKDHDDAVEDAGAGIDAVNRGNGDDDAGVRGAGGGGRAGRRGSERARSRTVRGTKRDDRAALRRQQ